MARCTPGGGALSVTSLQRRRMRARVLSAVASGNCSPVMPRAFQTRPQGPIGVSKMVKPGAVGETVMALRST